jgi:hypothetical protein
MNNCGCVFADTDGASGVILTQMLRRARVPHTCVECRRLIRAGEQYEYVAGKWDDGLVSYYTCVDCVSVRDTFFCYGYNYGCVWDDIREHIGAVDGNISSDCLLALTPAARDDIFELIESVWAGINEREARTCTR